MTLLDKILFEARMARELGWVSGRPSENRFSSRGWAEIAPQDAHLQLMEESAIAFQKQSESSKDLRSTA